MERRYRQLAWRMTAAALLVALIPLYILGAGIYLYFQTVQRESYRNELQNLAINTANAMQLFLAERTATLEALAHAATAEHLARPGELRKLLRLLNRRRTSFLDLGIIDAQGNHLAYVGPYELQDHNYADSQWFDETMLDGVFISDIFLGHRGVPHLVIAVKHELGEQPWILRATIDPDVFFKLVRSAQLGTTGDAYIINRNGQLQTPSRFSAGVLEQAAFDVATAPPGVSVLETTRPDGTSVLTARAWLQDVHWLLVVDRDPSEPQASLLLARNTELALLAVGTILIVFAAMLQVRFLVRRLEAEDRKRATVEAQLAHSARLVSVGRMAAGVAHEINNPLAAIGELSGLLEDLIDDRFLESSPHAPLFRDNARKIQEHVERARTVTHRLLGFARRMEPRHDTVNINEVVEEALSFIERDAGFRNVNIERRLDTTIPVVETDRSQLQQVLLNLFNNALDAVAEGGRIIVQSKATKDTIEMAVGDSGTGIPKEIASRVFDPFFTTKGPGQGSGLGLSISHSIMQKLGGSLSFESEPGRGTVFRASLPRTTA